MVFTCVFMKNDQRFLQTGILALILCLLVQGMTTAAIVESGDLNIIDDPGNPSHGLRYLDMTYSDGKTLADALAAAQAVYPNARKATPSEWDDLFDAAGILYNGSLKASDAFAVAGSTIQKISTNANYNTSLRDALGPTASDATLIWSDPDGTVGGGTTRDRLKLAGTAPNGAEIAHFTLLPPNGALGWLLVSEPVPIISTYPAEYITCNAALLRAGVVSDSNLPVQGRFHYGPVGGAMQTTPWTDINISVFSAYVTGLYSGTEYVFQAEIKNAFVSSLAASQKTFTTDKCKIIWVTEDIDRDNDTIQDDQAWVDLLANAGYDVDVRPGYWTALEGVDANDANDYLGELNAADLVIVSRSTNSNNYDDGNEPALWNSITSPVIMMSTHIARYHRWLWFDTRYLLQLPLPEEAVFMDPNHPIFAGLPNPAWFYDPNVGTGANIFIVPDDAGNGTILATGDGLFLIVEWPAGVEYYDGAGQFTGEKRMFFAAGTRVIDGGQPQGAMNLTADGWQIFRNAVHYMINH